ncbi:MAG TPA: ATP-binding protein [Nocardioidaceae bacterium]|nr:ATP-binding protein [Nocardioidaceae bacterium]
MGLREHPGDGLDGGARTPPVNGRAGSDLGADLFGALADGVQVAVCDLRTSPVSAGYVVEMLSPVVRYLGDWPGAGVAVVCPPYSEIRSALRSMTRPHTLVLSDSAGEGMDQLHSRLPPLQRTELHLAAQLASPRASRLFVTRALLDWHLTSLVAKASLVVSELVTNAVVHAASAVDVTLSRADGRVQMLVRDQGAGHPQPRSYEPEHGVVGGRGLLLVSAAARAWGVFPASGGKAVWVVFDVPSPPNDA